MMWPEDLRKKRYGGTLTWGAQVHAPSVPTKPKAPPIPLGVRYRCAGCGHWFKQDDLPGHAQVCGQGEDADWAMMCCAECGCSSLDEAAKPKPGFPKKKAEPVTNTAEEGVNGDGKQD